MSSKSRKSRKCSICRKSRTSNPSRTNIKKWLQMAPNCSKWLQMAPNGFKWLQIAPKWLQMAPNGSKRLQRAQQGSKLLQMAPTVTKFLQLAPNGSELLQMATHDSKWLQIAPNGSKWLQMAPDGYKWLHGNTNSKKKKSKCGNYMIKESQFKKEILNELVLLASSQQLCPASPAAASQAAAVMWGINQESCASHPFTSWTSAAQKKPRPRSTPVLQVFARRTKLLTIQGLQRSSFQRWPRNQQ